MTHIDPYLGLHATLVWPSLGFEAWVAGALFALAAGVLRGGEAQRFGHPARSVESSRAEVIWAGVVESVALASAVVGLGLLFIYAGRYVAGLFSVRYGSALDLTFGSASEPRASLWTGLVIAVLGVWMVLGRSLRRATADDGQHRHWFAPWLHSQAAAGALPDGRSERAWARDAAGAVAMLLCGYTFGGARLAVGMVCCFCAGQAGGRAFSADWAPRLPARTSGTIVMLLGAAIVGRALAVSGLSFSHAALRTDLRTSLGPALFVAGLGLVLGVRHSTDADHVVAISTIVTRERSLRGAAWIGTLWGLGHTLTIFVVGCLIILCGVAIPPRVGLSMEFSVALMLILLGVLNLSGVMQKIVSRFSPEASTLRIEDARGAGFARYGIFHSLRPLAIGLVHGLAGSAAIALLVLSTIHSPVWAVVYLVIFGVGTMLGMMCMTMAMSLPLVFGGDRLPRISHYLGVASGLVSVCFGTFLVYQLGYVGGLFTAHPHWTPQ